MEDGQRNITSFLGKRERIEKSESLPDAIPEKDSDKELKDSWICSTCGHRLDFTNPMYDLLLQEHQDYHFALELSRTPASVPAPSRSRSPHTSVTTIAPAREIAPKRRKKDIRAFFTPR